jgi:membrane associated rhomboid family serine protease/Flp pilus assembly protein TadD
VLYSEFCMANCVQCGKELPSFSVGELQDRCVECQVRERIERERQAKADRPGAMQLAQMFPVTAALVAINVLIYAGCAIDSLKTGRGSPMDFDPIMLLSWGADYGPLALGGQFWRIFTSMFVHGGLIHVGANMWCLWSIGRLAERVYGRWRYLIIYLLTGLASSVASLAIHPSTISVGASGAIFGVVGALVFPFYRKRVVLPPPVLKSMLRSLLTFIVINLLIGAAVPIIDNSAHVGGLFAGLLLGAIITHFAITGDDMNEVFPKIAAVTAILIGSAFAGVQHLHRDRILPEQSSLALQQGNTQYALERAKEAVARNPKNALAHIALGDVYWTKNQFPDAAKEYRAAYDLEPNDAQIAGVLGSAYVASAQWKEAEPVLRQALKADPHDAANLQNLGISLAAQGRPKEALPFLQEAVLKNPKSASARYDLASALLDLHEYKEALDPLREAVRLDPKNEDYKKTLESATAQASGK